MKYSIQDRTIILMKLLIDSNSYVSIEEISQMLGISKRNVYYALNDINDYLIKGNRKKLTAVYSKGYLLDDETKRYLYDIYTKSNPIQIYSLSSDERQNLIICELICGTERLTIERFESLFCLSRFTLINDINSAKKIAAKFGINVTFTLKDGYVADAYLEQLVKAFSYCFSNVYSIYLNHSSILKEFSFINILKKNYESLVLFNKNNIYFDCSICALSCLLSISNVEINNIELLDINLIGEEYSFLCKHFPKLSFNSLRYFATYLYSSRVVQEYKCNDKQTSEICNIVQKMNKVFYQLTSITVNKFAIYEPIVKHLLNSYLRIKYSVCVDNPLILDIKGKYSLFFSNSRKICSHIEKHFDIILSDNEIGFICLYYAGYAINNKINYISISATLICANGYATSYLLQNEIESLDSRIVIDNCTNIHEFSYSTCHSDLIITTIDLYDAKENVVRVSPILTSDDKQKIIQEVNKIIEEKRNKNMKVKIDIIGNNYYINNNLVFEKDYIQIYDNQDNDIEKILMKASEPLIRNNYIPEYYVDQIINSTKEFGFYMVVKNGYFFAHAPSSLVQKIGFSFLKITHPIQVEDKIVSKIFVVTPVNMKEYRSIVDGLMKLFTNDKLSKQIDECDDVDEIYSLISSCFTN